MAAVMGNETVPMFPRRSKVEKSFDSEMPIVERMSRRLAEPT
jgi:hypothetical protein